MAGNADKDALENDLAKFLTETRTILGRVYPSCRVRVNNGRALCISGPDRIDLSSQPVFYVEHFDKHGKMRFGHFWDRVAGISGEKSDDRGHICYIVLGTGNLHTHLKWLERQSHLNGDEAPKGTNDIKQSDEIYAQFMARLNANQARANSTKKRKNWMPFKID